MARRSSKKTSIEYILSLDDASFNKKVGLVGKKLSWEAKRIAKRWEPVTGVFTKTAKAITLAATAAGTAAVAGGFYALQSVLRSSVTEALALDSAMYNMGASLTAANRQFDVGSVTAWESALAGMRKELKVFSETDLRNASARTIDMTKRLGLSKDQMLEVMRVSANLGAGKFALVDSVERVTAALRGEAEASEALGLTLNENYVKAWNKANNATGKAWKDLTDLEKAQVRYNVLLEQASASAGRAAGSYNTMSGVSVALASSYNELKTAIGAVVTQNTFFIKGGQLIDGLLQKWKKGIEANRGEWMLWAKESTLAVLDFSVTVVGAMSVSIGIFNAFNKTLLLAYTSVLRLTSGYIYYRKVLAQVAGDEKLVKKLHVDRLEIQYDIQQQYENIMSADAAADKANKYAENAAKKIKSLRDALEKIEAKPIEKTATATDKASKAMEGYERKVVKVGDTWEDTWVKTEDESSRAIGSIKRQLQDLQNTDWTVRVPIERVNSGGGGGGGYKTGGIIRKFAAGGKLPGFGGGDRIPALLEAGEFVIRKEAVSKFGAGIFHALNSFRLPELPKFATGGPVMAGAGGETININLSLPGGSGPVSVRADRYNADKLVRDVARMRRLRSA